MTLDEVTESFTDAQKQHVEIMQRIAQCFSDTTMVLKGGTALLLAYKLDRYSEDLDFDSTKHINPLHKIREAVRKTRINIESIDEKKNTDTVKRWMISYSGPSGSGKLKLEVSYRQEEIDEDVVHEVDGIKVYKLFELINQKLGAAENRSKVRDLFDLDYLAREYREHFTSDQIRRLQEMASDIGTLQGRYEADHQEDSILKSIDLEELVLTLNQSAEEMQEEVAKPGPL